MAREGTGWSRVGWFHPDGYVIYPDGSTASWPADLGPPDGDGIRHSAIENWRYLPYDDSVAHYHLYYDVASGRLLNGRTGVEHRWPIDIHSVEFQELEAPTEHRHGKYLVVCERYPGIAPDNPIDPCCGRVYRDWPPRT